MRTALPMLLTCLLLALAGCAADAPPASSAPEPTTCGDVRNLSVAGEIYMAGQPTADDFALLRARGIKTVINYRRQSEFDLNERAIVEGLGMTYVHYPWNGPDMLTDARLDEMRRQMRDSERAILVHCGSANRVGAVWLAYRVLDEGVALETAIAEARAVGLRTEAYETITLAYIERNQ